MGLSNLKIKEFKFPSFDEFVENKNEMSVNMGAYKVECRPVSWGSHVTQYAFACSLSNMNTMNVFTDKFFYEVFQFDYQINNEQEFRQWYYNCIKRVNKWFTQMIQNTYLEGEM